MVHNEDSAVFTLRQMLNKVVKSGRIRWAGIVARMAGETHTYFRSENLKDSLPFLNCFVYHVTEYT